MSRLIKGAGTKAMKDEIHINPMDGHSQALSSRFWRFGADWPGQRCGARTRNGSPCQKPALSGKTRCQLHGGRAGAPSGEQNGNYRTGHFTKKAMQARTDAALRMRELVTLGRMIGMFE